MRLSVGLDLGSRSVKGIVLDCDSGAIVAGCCFDAGIRTAEDADLAVSAMLKYISASKNDVVAMMATGYGRAGTGMAPQTATEITCHAVGVRAIFPNVRTIVDIGGQDSKAICISPNGKVRDFSMNDRCAAGTGRFLEVAARILKTDVEGMASLSRTASSTPELSSMCVVFAESEVLGMLANGAIPADIAAGLHSALAKRVAALAQRMDFEPPIAFTGGVALNSAMVTALGSELLEKLSVPSDPRFTGALGAALLAAENAGIDVKLSIGSDFKPPLVSVHSGSILTNSDIKTAPMPVETACSRGSCEPQQPRKARYRLPAVSALKRFERMIPNCIDYVTDARSKGQKIVSIFCEYTPRELIIAAGAVPVCACGGSHRTAQLAETELPANLCPLIKSSYGYALDSTSPLFELSDMVVAETTCDGKKKMYELLHKRLPVHVLELTQKPDENDAFNHWLSEIVRLKERLEKLTGNTITDERLRDAIVQMNRERELRYKIASWSGRGLSGSEVLLAKSSVSCIPEDISAYEEILNQLEQRGIKPDGKPRLILTGVPMPHGAEKVLELIEECGATVVAQESCTGIKPLYESISIEGDPLTAIARKYFHLPCSCMTPNTGRFDLLDKLISDFGAQGVVDLVWQACHTYNVEAVALKRHIEKKHGIPYLKIETDYSSSDREQLRLRLESFIAMIV